MAAGCVPDEDTPCGPWRVSEDVTLLPPGTPGGVEVFTEVGLISQTKNTPNPSRNGVKSFTRLLEEGSIKNTSLRNKWRLINKNHNNKIFFRAPYAAGNSFESSYPSITFVPFNPDSKYRQREIVTILVDPNETYVYDSDVRAHGIGNAPNYEFLNSVKQELADSRIKLADYLAGGVKGREYWDQEIVIQTPRISSAWFVHSGLMKNFKRVSPPTIIPPVKTKVVTKTSLNVAQEELEKARAMPDKTARQRGSRNVAIAAAEAKVSSLQKGGKRRKTRRKNK